MLTNNYEPPDNPRLAEEVEEVSLLLPSRQFSALAEVAEVEGLTIGQYLRGLVNQALTLAANERKCHSA